jgi:hypothetical protein
VIGAAGAPIRVVKMKPYLFFLKCCEMREMQKSFATENINEMSGNVWALCWAQGVAGSNPVAPTNQKIVISESVEGFLRGITLRRHSCYRFAAA